MTKNNIIHFIDFVNTFDTNDLLTNSILENIILSAGLNNEILEEQPKELSQYFGTGFELKIWQYPNQFVPYLLFLSKFSDRINSYLEIGSRYGGTYIITSEFLSRVCGRSISAIACDIIDIPDNILQYNLINKNSKYLHGNSQSDQIKNLLSDQHISIVLIDGDHRYNEVKNDAMLMINKANILVFHDISNDNCPDVSRYWKEFKEFYFLSHNFYEFTDQYCSVDGNFLGIGCAVKKDFDIQR